MATIVHDAVWTLTDEAAARMAENNLIEVCKHNHIRFEDFDHPIYHIHPHAPSWFGFSTMDQAIRSAEQHAEEARNEQQSLVQPAPDAPG